MLEVNNITKKFGDFRLCNVTFTVEKGTYFILLGGSGSGKSVLLEIISGITFPDSGHITLNGKDITNAPVQKRRTAMVYQDQALFPHLNVFENIAYPLRCKKMSLTVINKKVHEQAALVEVEPLLTRKPLTLSGGEAQRVALARALASNPDCLLLDEPLSNVDAPLRYGLRRLLRCINASGQTIVHVTHDFEEALSLAQELAVIENGAIVQQGKPDAVFLQPKSEFVAHFTGIRNFFRGKLITSSDNEGIKYFSVKNTTIRISNADKGGEGYLIIPPESVVMSEEVITGNTDNVFQGEIIDYFPARGGIEIVINTGDIIITSLLQEGKQVKSTTISGKKVWLHIDSQKVQFIPLE